MKCGPLSLEILFMSLIQNKKQIIYNVVLVCFWLAIVNTFALIAMNRLKVIPDKAFPWINPAYFTVQRDWNIINIHNRWDSAWFIDAAQNGYHMRGENTFSNVVFFPLYPFAMKLVSLMTGGDFVLAGWIVSSFFLFAAVVIFTRFVQEFHMDIDPFWPVLFLLVFPTSFFLNTVYSESMFLFLSITTFYFALKKQFWKAALFAALASATRLAGVFLLAPLVVEFIQSKGWRALLSRDMLPLLLAPGGAFAFFLFHLYRFGDFFLYLKVESWWGRDFSDNVDGIDEILTHSGISNWIIEWSFALFAFAAAILVLWKFRRSYGIYMLLSLSIAFTSGGTFGIGRYAMVLFPIYIFAATIPSMHVKAAWLLTSTLFLSLDIVLFVNHYWAG